MQSDEPLTHPQSFVKADPTGQRFDGIDATSVPASFFGLTSYASAVAKVPRSQAMQVPAVKRGRDLIAGTLATIPWDLFNGKGEVSNDFSELLKQPERGIARSVTLAKTIEDMMYDGVAWWLVTETGWKGYPTKVIRLDSSVDVAQQARAHATKEGHHGTSVRYDDDFDLIRFDSPNDPLLVAGARAIRTHIALDQAVNVYSNGDQPLDYFTPSDNSDPDQADLDAALDAWEAARQLHATGYVPSSLKYNTAGWNPEQLQLAAQRDHASKELATLMGLQAERVNVSTTSRTYSNIQQDRQEFVDFTLNGYGLAMSERLSMGDVTPRGFEVKWRWAEFLRTDDQTRMAIAAQGKTVRRPRRRGSPHLLRRLAARHGCPARAGSPPARAGCFAKQGDRQCPLSVSRRRSPPSSPSTRRPAPSRVWRSRSV